MSESTKRLWLSVIALAVWVAITMGVGLLQVGPGTSLDKFASEQIVWGTPARPLGVSRATSRTCLATAAPTT